MNRIVGYSVGKLIADLDGVSVVGDLSIVCHDALPLTDAGPGCITLIDDEMRCDEVNRVAASAVVTSQRFTSLKCTQIVCDDIHQVFTGIVKQFRHKSAGIKHSSIDSTAQIDPTASIGSGTRVDAGVIIGADVRIGNDCHLMPGTVVMEQSQIGDNCILFPRVVLYEHTVIDTDVLIHAGSVIGAYGFGYRQVEGRHVLSAQLGYVHLESNVEVGANVTIDRGTYGVTRIGTGTKIDNLVMIAHNCHIGRHNLICSQVGVAGSCRTGDYVILAGQVGLADHITLGDHAIIGAQSGVMENLAGDQIYLGTPATMKREQMQIMAAERRLPELRREIKSLRRDLEQVKQNGTQSAAAPSADADIPTRCLAFKRPAA